MLNKQLKNRKHNRKYVGKTLVEMQVKKKGKEKKLNLVLRHKWNLYRLKFLFIH